MERPKSQHYDMFADDECSNAQSPSNRDVLGDNLVNNNVPVFPPMDSEGMDATPATDDSVTPAKDVAMTIDKNEQAASTGNAAPTDSPAHLVMEILDEVLSTPCSSSAKSNEAGGNHGQVETIEDIQAFVNRPVSSSINEAKITPEKDDKEKDHSKVVRKLNMETEENETVMASQLRKTAQQKKRKDAKTSAKRVSRSARSGLVFPVSRVMGKLRKGKYAKHIGVTSAVYLTAVLEYLVAEVLELSGNCAKYYNKRRVFPRCILLTLRHDTELDQLTKGAIVPQGGVKPFIHRELLPVERQDSHFHPRFGGFLSTQDMLKYNLKPSFQEGAASPASSQAD